MKTGQITLFIIIGMLILITLGIAVYIGSAVKKELGTARTASAEQIEEVITSCLRQTLEDGMILIGQQGGKIYTTQGGIHTESAQTTLSEPIGTVGSPNCEATKTCFFYSTPPDYPFLTYPFIAGEQVFSGYYGINNLPPLYSQDNEQSVQETLEKYITTKTQICANLSQFDAYDISSGTPTVELIFAKDISQLETETALTAQLKWSVNATDLDGNIAHLEMFTVRIPVRLGAIYYAAKQKIDADVTEINFEPKTEHPFVITIGKTEQGSTINLTDVNSNVHGAPYTFTITRHNRAPALWLIDELDTIYVPPDGATNLRINGNKLSAQQPCEKFTTKELTANDPDNDVIAFSVNNAQAIEITASDIPQKTIRIYANDKQNADFQEITLNVALCAPQ